ncbi:TetR/AcrR family transcriptional regulator [Nocardia sp. CA2R105]|uniref:TetR/AcrR family transcriptional regulator n=1 Tax=Nocardia coffeae TaxID=2873381 RepID=UPI001CA67C25|nr:TetR/AcrR family transcriptional regulator [Nocardia coffeae]MBY8863403.1 TetR/AcrR family transcriptional regulator [Nocardia coffeae]
MSAHRTPVSHTVAQAAPRRRKQADRTAESRERLISAAIELLGEKGYSRTTLVEIGQRAGLSRGLVTFHFGSKEQCMLAVVDAIRSNVQAALESASSSVRGLEALDLFIDKYLMTEEPTSSTSIRAMYVIIIESVTSSPGLREAVAENNAVFRQMLANRIAQAREDGEIVLNDSADDLATFIEGLLRGVLIQCLADPDAIDLRRIADLTKSILRSYLRTTMQS